MATATATVTEASEGLQGRMWRELQAAAGESTIPFTEVLGSVKRRPSSENLTIDAYAEQHREEFDSLLALAGDEGWTFNREEDGVRAFLKSVEGSDLMYFKGVADIEVEGGLARILHVILNIEERPSWDEQCVKGSSEQFFPPFYKYTYTQTGPLAAVVSAREMLTVGRFRFEEDGTFLFSLRSTEYEDMPLDDKLVRTNLREGGYIIRPKEGSKTEFSITWTGCLDPCGWIPKWVVNKVMPKQALALAKVKKLF
mmetsp:Transcript_34203/g.99307  ORF Transcript_34203/g.99307 Transcript_34203/m.99307 type:complete len:255 (+) Transcript_34203:87-851(+)